ncbi:MAG: ABC transporter permease, partial [Bacteroidota bacterium]
MLKNIFLTSIRSIVKNKATFSLNTFALMLGIAACIIALLHVDHELSFDKYHSNSNRIYRVVTGNVASGEGWVKVSTPIAPKIKEELPEVETYARLTPFSYNAKVAVEFNNEVFNEEHVHMADPDFFKMFDINIVQGVPLTNNAKNTVVISERMAEKYMGNGNVIGQNISIDRRMDFNIVGVFETLPSNSHFDLDFVIPFENLEAAKPGTSLNGNWGQFNYFSYLMLREDADAIATGRKLREILVEFGDNQSMKFENLRFQALADIHFQANPGNIKPAYDTRYLQIYGGIALAILMISIINFINLSIASSTKRIREVGIRKVLGASRKQLIIQFVSESVIICMSASIFALFLTWAVLPYFNNIIASNLTLDLSNPLLIFGIAILNISIAALSGLYIALFILSFRVVNAVKGVIKVGDKGKRFKSTLMTVQFAVSCILIISSVFVYRQLDHLKNQNIGLEQNGVITLQLYDQESQGNTKLLIDRLETIAGIRSISASNFSPGAPNWHQRVTWDDQPQETSWDLILADKNFIETFDLQLTEGRPEDIKAISNSQKYTYLINEAALKATQWDQGLGKMMSAMGADGRSAVAGVVADFNYRSLHNTVDPCAIVIMDSKTYSQVSIKFESEDIFKLVENIQASFEEVMPYTPFEYAFADEQFDQLYKVEEQTSQLVGVLTVVSIVLALMGVFSMLSFTIKERTKEIAIRKILGINIKETMILLSSDYFKLLIISNLIAIPLAWYFVDRWLENFAYSIDINLYALIALSLVSFLIILTVVGFKVFQIEKIN